MVGAPSQGQQAWPLANPTAFVNNNNNYQAPALPGPLANPTPGTIVIHINGKVQTEVEGNWTNQDLRFVTAPAAGSFSAGQGVNGTGPVKLEPITINAFMRLYFGADAMATNGLRYGAAIELRQNFAGAISSNSILERQYLLLDQLGLRPSRVHLRRGRELGHRAPWAGGRHHRHLRQRRDHLAVGHYR